MRATASARAPPHVDQVVSCRGTPTIPSGARKTNQKRAPTGRSRTQLVRRGMIAQFKSECCTKRLM